MTTVTPWELAPWEGSKKGKKRASAGDDGGGSDDRGP